MQGVPIQLHESMSFMHQYNANFNVPFEVVPLIMGDDAFNTITASSFVPTHTQILPSMYLPPGYDYANQQCVHESIAHIMLSSDHGALASTNPYIQLQANGQIGRSYPTYDLKLLQ